MKLLPGAVGVSLFLFSSMILAQYPSADSAADDSFDGGNVDVRVTAALDRMAAHLRTLNHFSLQARTLIDVVDSNGQKLQFAGTLEYKAAPPSALHLTETTDRRIREYFFNGKTLIIHAPRIGFYTDFAAPGTIKELIITLEQEAGINLPLADLFLWGTPESFAVPVHAAKWVGPSQIEGDVVDHFAFRQGAADWQVWITRGDAPLPRKFVVTAREIDGMPSYSADLAWEIDERIEPQDIAFSPPANAVRIRFEPALAESEVTP